MILSEPKWPKEKKRKHTTQLSLIILFHIRGKNNLRNIVKFRVQRPSCTKRLWPNHKIPSHQTTKRLFITVSFTLPIKKKFSRDTKIQKHSLKKLNNIRTRVRYGRNSGIIRSEFFKTMIYMLRALTEKDMKENNE